MVNNISYRFDIEHQSDASIKQKVLGQSGHSPLYHQDIWLQLCNAPHTLTQVLMLLCAPSKHEKHGRVRTVRGFIFQRHYMKDKMHDSMCTMTNGK